MSLLEYGFDKFKEELASKENNYSYELCPSRYVNVPALTWDSEISKRYSKARKKYFISYDPKQESKHIT